MVGILQNQNLFNNLAFRNVTAALEIIKLNKKSMLAANHKSELQLNAETDGVKGLSSFWPPSEMLSQD